MAGLTTGKYLRSKWEEKKSKMGPGVQGFPGGKWEKHLESRCEAGLERVLGGSQRSGGKNLSEFEKNEELDDCSCPAWERKVKGGFY